MDQVVSGFQGIIKWVGYFIIGISRVTTYPDSPSAVPVYACCTHVIMNGYLGEWEMTGHPI